MDGNIAVSLGSFATSNTHRNHKSVQYRVPARIIGSQPHLSTSEQDHDGAETEKSGWENQNCVSEYERHDAVIHMLALPRERQASSTNTVYHLVSHRRPLCVSGRQVQARRT